MAKNNSHLRGIILRLHQEQQLERLFEDHHSAGIVGKKHSQAACWGHFNEPVISFEREHTTKGEYAEIQYVCILLLN